MNSVSGETMMIFGRLAEQGGWNCHGREAVYGVSSANERTSPMAFLKDQKSLGVIDSENGYALKPYVRDVPRDEKWFRFLFEDREFIAKAKCSWSEDGNRVIYVFQVKQLENSFQFSPSHRDPRYEPTPQEFRARVLPALSDAVAAMMRHWLPNRPSLAVEVQLID
jgi:hypothetical protein